MDRTWAVLARYKLLEEKVAQLRLQVEQVDPGSMEIARSLDEAEEELQRLRAWIGLTYEVVRGD